MKVFRSFFFSLMILCYLCTHNFISDYPMAKKNEIIVKDIALKTMSKDGIDYISITDIARQKNATDPNGVIANWMRNRNTVEFLGIWETLHNPNFNPLEFEGVRKEAGLICLSNMENINAVLINDGVPQGERLVKLNQIAIQQMQVLEGNEGRKLLK